MHPGPSMRIATSLGLAAAILLVSVAGSAPGTRTVSSVAGTASPAPLAAAHGEGPVAAAVATRLSFRLPSVAGEEYTPNAPNIAIRSTADGPLLLFLPATRAVPRDYRSFLDTASAAGYHVLALDYWNLGRSVAQTCGPRPDCYGNVQANRFDGSHATRFSAIETSDSILARLTHALKVLATRDPAGGWTRYLHGDTVIWNRLVVAGHSQGGGEAAYIAHRHEVQGVLLFASPVASDGTVTASWLTRHGQTPKNRYFGFDAAGDMYFHRIQGSWAALRIGGSNPVATVTDTLPFGTNHRIVTTMPLGSPSEAHSFMITDRGPRTGAGAPVFRPIWQWMLTAARSHGGGA